MTHFTESIIEEAALDWFKDLGYTIVFGGDIAPEEPTAEREDYGEVILAGRLKAALKRINPSIPAEASGRCLSQSHTSHFPIAGRQQPRFSQNAGGWHRSRIPPGWTDQGR